MGRPAISILLFFCTIGLITMVACGSSTPSPKALTETPTSDQVLRDSADRMSSIKWVAFSLKHENGSTSLGSLALELQEVKGQVELPDRFQVQVGAAPSGGTGYVQIGIIAIDGQAYMNLLGRWAEADLGTLPFNFTDLGRTLSDIMLAMQDVTFSPSEIVEGKEAFRVKGSVSSDALQTLVPNASSGFTIGLEVWIGQDDPLLYKAQVEGQLFSYDQPDVVRVLTLSDFDVPVDIEPPS